MVNVLRPVEPHMEADDRVSAVDRDVVRSVGVRQQTSIVVDQDVNVLCSCGARC